MKLLEKHINKCHLAILDNARNQSHEAVRKELQRIFHGLFVFLPAYTPEFAPVEHIIHLVRSHIAANIDNLEKTEIHLLHDALEHYSTTGSGSHCASEMFHMYRTNHNVWLSRR